MEHVVKAEIDEAKYLRGLTFSLIKHNFCEERGEGGGEEKKFEMRNPLARRGQPPPTSTGSFATSPMERKRRTSHHPTCLIMRPLSKSFLMELSLLLGSLVTKRKLIVALSSLLRSHRIPTSGRTQRRSLFKTASRIKILFSFTTNPPSSSVFTTRMHQQILVSPSQSFFNSRVRTTEKLGRCQHHSKVVPLTELSHAIASFHR